MKLELGTSYANDAGHIRKVNVIYTRYKTSMVEYIDENNNKGNCSYNKFLKWLKRTN